MSKDVLLSIVIPFYNVELYIEKCLISIIDQTEMLENIEIICVDDCSPDNSHLIVEKLMLEYDFIKLIRHSVNKKVGGARNTGLRNAIGKYIWFVDPDDYIAPNSTNKILTICENNNLDAYVFNLTKFDSVKTYPKEDAFIELSDQVYAGVDLLKSTFREGLIYHLGYPVRGVFRKELLNRYDLLFPESVSYGEETVFVSRNLIYSKRVMSTNESFYYYRQNPNSVTNKLEIKYKGELVFQSIVNAGNYVEDLIEEVQQIDLELSESIRAGMEWFVNRLLFRLLRTSYKERVLFFELCRKNKDLVDRLYNYFSKPNQLILQYPFFSILIISLVKPVYNLKRSFHC